VKYKTPPFNLGVPEKSPKKRKLKGGLRGKGMGLGEISPSGDVRPGPGLGMGGRSCRRDIRWNGKGRRATMTRSGESGGRGPEQRGPR